MHCVQSTSLPTGWTSLCLTARILNVDKSPQFVNCQTDQPIGVRVAENHAFYPQMSHVAIVQRNKSELDYLHLFFFFCTHCLSTLSVFCSFVFTLFLCISDHRLLDLTTVTVLSVCFLLLLLHRSFVFYRVLFLFFRFAPLLVHSRTTLKPQTKMRRETNTLFT